MFVREAQIKGRDLRPCVYSMRQAIRPDSLTAQQTAGMVCLALTDPWIVQRRFRSEGFLALTFNDIPFTLQDTRD